MSNRPAISAARPAARDVGQIARLSTSSRLLAGAVAIGCAACIDLSSDPQEIVAIEFPLLPAPSVVAGDSLRDATGAAVPLAARLFDGSGAEVTGQTVEFLSRDTTVSIVGGNFVVGRATADGIARLVASGAGIQSIVRQLEVVPRPDSLAAVGAVDTLRLTLLGTPQDNTSAAITVKVLNVEGTAEKVVRAWPVTFSLEYDGLPVAPGDTSKVWLVNDAGVRGAMDTTDTQGLASRRVRYRLGAVLPPLDSVIVNIQASYRGAPLGGSPIRRVLPVKPKT